MATATYTFSTGVPNIQPAVYAAGTSTPDLNTDDEVTNSAGVLTLVLDIGDYYAQWRWEGDTHQSSGEVASPDTLGEVAARAAVSGGSTTGWDENAVSAVEADWTVYDGGGTWTFVGGVISQTDESATDAAALTDPLPGSSFIVQADVRCPSGQDALLTPTLTLAAGCVDLAAGSLTAEPAGIVGEGFYLVASGTGDSTLTVSPNVDGNSDPIPGIGALAQDTWHTIRAVVNGVRQVVYHNGDFLMSAEIVTGGNSGGLNGSDRLDPYLVALGLIGKWDVRNITVWTPTLPA